MSWLEEALGLHVNWIWTAGYWKDAPIEVALVVKVFFLVLLTFW